MITSIAHLLRFTASFALVTTMMSTAKASVVTYSGDVTAQGMTTLIESVAQLANAGDRNITVSLDSGGGDLAAALKASHALREYGVNTSAHNDCSSSCTVLFAAGINRSASSSTTFLFHAVKVAKKKSKGIFTSELSSEETNVFVTKYSNLWLDAVRLRSPLLADKLQREKTLTSGSREYRGSSLRKLGFVNN